jgi:hypothetical protein
MLRHTHEQLKEAARLRALGRPHSVRAFHLPASLLDCWTFRSTTLSTRNSTLTRMDPVSLTPAILPLVAGALKVFKTTRSKFKVFCRYSSEVERTRKLFGSQQDCFLNEVELMVRMVLEDHGLVREMMKDSRHAKWHARNLESKLKENLGRSLER